MFKFRRMELSDLQKIYQNQELKGLLTAAPVGEKFGIVIEDDNCLVGGATGYKEKKSAVIQRMAVLETPEADALKDGLIRSAAHMLERDGAVLMMTLKGEDEEIYHTIGFHSGEDFPVELLQHTGTLIQQELAGSLFLWLDLQKFFESPCSCS